MENEINAVSRQKCSRSRPVRLIKGEKGENWRVQDGNRSLGNIGRKAQQMQDLR